MNDNEILNTALDVWKFKTKYIDFKGFEEEDLEQDLLIKVFVKVRENYDETKSQISTYISKIVDNHIKDLFIASSRYKNYARYTSESLDTDFNEYERDSILMFKEDEYSTIELKNYLNSLGLTESEKKVIKYLFEGYSKSDIAEILNVSRARISYIIKSLKNKLKGEYDNYVTSV